MLGLLIRDYSLLETYYVPGTVTGHSGHSSESETPALLPRTLPCSLPPTTSGQRSTPALTASTPHTWTASAPGSLPRDLGHPSRHPSRCPLTQRCWLRPLIRHRRSVEPPPTLRRTRRAAHPPCILVFFSSETSSFVQGDNGPGKDQDFGFRQLLWPAGSKQNSFGRTSGRVSGRDPRLVFTLAVAALAGALAATLRA